MVHLFSIIIVSLFFPPSITKYLRDPRGKEKWQNVGFNYSDHFEENNYVTFVCHQHNLQQLLVNKAVVEVVAGVPLPRFIHYLTVC